MFVFPSGVLLDIHADDALATVTRTGPQTQNEFFEVVDGAISTLSAKVASWIVTGRDLLNVPETDRLSENRMFSSDTRLFTAEGGQVPDVLAYRGRSYRITGVENIDPESGCYLYRGVMLA